MSWKPATGQLNDRASSLVRELGLQPHPEGGFYAELYRSAAVVAPSDGRGTRPALTTIYFLLPAGAVSRWHRVLSDEIWHFYEGAPLDLWTTPLQIGVVSRNRLGPLSGEQQPVVTVPSGWWQAARSTGAYTLAGCSVAPGFDFSDFTLAQDDPAARVALQAQANEYAELL
jgi:predicted cupin superfamily sugar epimerase